MVNFMVDAIIILVCGLVVIQYDAMENAGYWEGKNKDRVMISCIAGVILGMILLVFACGGYDFFGDTDVYTSETVTYYPEVVQTEDQTLYFQITPTPTSVRVSFWKDGQASTFTYSKSDIRVFPTEDKPRMEVTTPHLSKKWYSLFLPSGKGESTADIYVDEEDFKRYQLYMLEN